ncbi:unnamed protein product [Peronospora belbahrii]|uniref:Uncharacterized protein n=1 Tax=Peronospora belbahrii TaxID=622444 RepID=A0AAU9LCD3_9STRA|nr:unnamed protein product [Peronospora belbahrii]
MLSVELQECLTEASCLRLLEQEVQALLLSQEQKYVVPLVTRWKLTRARGGIQSVFMSKRKPSFQFNAQPKGRLDAGATFCPEQAIAHGTMSTDPGWNVAKAYEVTPKYNVAVHVGKMSTYEK